VTTQLQLVVLVVVVVVVVVAVIIIIRNSHESRACDDTFQVCRGRKNKTRIHRSRELRFKRWSTGFRYRVASLAIIAVSEEPAASIFYLTM